MGTKQFEAQKRLKGSQLLQLAQPHVSLDQRAAEYKITYGDDDTEQAPGVNGLNMLQKDEDEESNMPYQMVDDSILNIQLSQIGNIRRGSRLRGAGYDPLSSGARKNFIEPQSMNFKSGLRGLKSPDPTQSSEDHQKPKPIIQVQQASAIDPTEDQEADFNDYQDFGQKTSNIDPTENEHKGDTFGKKSPPKTTADGVTEANANHATFGKKQDGTVDEATENIKP